MTYQKHLVFPGKKIVAVLLLKMVLVMAMPFPALAADNIAPIIILLGDNPVFVNQSDTYTEPGYMALDDTDGDITASVVVNDPVNKDVAGTFLVTYNVSDAAGNPAMEMVRTVTVLASGDSVPPMIFLMGINPVELFVGDTFTEPGYMALDDTDGDITANVNVTGSVDTTTAGSYTLFYNVSDAAGNNAFEITRTVNVNGATDVIAPLIMLLGDDPVVINLYDNYEEPGYMALDDTDGDITPFVETSNNIDPWLPGTYTVRYNVSDFSGNQAAGQTRTVIIAGSDNTPPIIILLGDSVINLNQGDTYIEPGYMALDDTDGDITAHVVVTGSVDTNTAGSYTKTYNVFDNAGNPALAVTRTVNVTAAPDTIAPMILLLGDNPVELTVGDTYTEPGYMALDDTDGDITGAVVIIGAVNAGVAGTYTLFYNVSDAAGNDALAMDRTVNVNEPDVVVTPDLTPPVLGNGAPSGAFNSGTTQAKLSLDTDEDAVCKYNTVANTDFASSTSVMSTTGSTTHETMISGLADGKSYTYYVRCEDALGNSNTAAFVISFSVKSAPAPSGGGGGGGYSAPTPAVQETAAQDTTATTTKTEPVAEEENEEVAVEGVEFEANQGLASLADVAGEIVEAVSLSEAQEVIAYNQRVILDETTVKLYNMLAERAKNGMTDEEKYSLAYFIHYGTATTKRLGAGERAGVVNSYLSVYGKLPKSLSDWQDVIKIANGRWPSERNLEAEETAQNTHFVTVYKRFAAMDNPHDNAAVTIITYGLRPANRNVDSEQAAVKIYKAIFGHDPFEALDWDIVRAIAYSGAAR